MKNVKRNFLTALIPFSIILLLLAGGAAAAQPSGGNNSRRTERFNGKEVAAGQVLVKFRNVSAQGVAQAVREVGADVKRKVGRAGAHLLQSSSKDTATLIRELSARADVLYVEPNYVVRPTATPNDLRFTELWGLHNTGHSTGAGAGTAGADIGAVSAWDVSKGSRDSVIAVIDTGVDYKHPDLAANMWSAPAAFTVNIGGQTIRCEAGTHGFNAITKTCDPAEEYDHGTHVAGTIGAAGNNGVGGVGINWTASIMAIKFIDATGSGTLSDAIDAIEFAIQARQALGAGANVRVLSNSWGWNGEASQALLDQINLANASDMLFVAGSGNGGADRVSDNNDVSPFYPASYDAPNVVAVAATDNNDALAAFSNYGVTKVHLGAPGVLIYSTIKGGLYDWWSGTSMATPHVSGAAALVLSRCALDTENLKNILLNNVDPTPALSGITTTGGRLNVNKAIRACADLTKPDNSWPAVEIVGPSNGAAFTTPASITVSATASDSDGVISKVDFYAGAQLIGTASTSPYSNITWSNAAAGTYSLTAVATDDHGATTTSSPVKLTVSDPAPTPSPTPTPTPVPSPTPTPTPSPTQRVNYALSANGGAATASSYYSDPRSGTYLPSAVNDGSRRGATTGALWLDKTPSAWPDWVEVSFSGAKTITEVVVVTQQDNTTNEPTDETTFTRYGVTSFEVQYWTGAAWQAAPGGTVAGNNKVVRRITFAPVTTSKIRVVISAGADNTYSRLVEVEAWGDPPPPPPPAAKVNHALTSNGGVASASSYYSDSRSGTYPPSAVIDGSRRGASVGTLWLDKTPSSWPDWVEVAFNGARSIGEVVVVTQQDNTAADPTDETTFTKYGVTSFEVRYWDGSQWQTVPGGAVTGNDRVVRRITFPAVTTTKVRVVVTGGKDNTYSRLVEVEALGDPAPPPTTPARVNHALGSNGGVATASSYYSNSYGTFLPRHVNDGARRALNGAIWLDGTHAAFPDWVEVGFNGTKSITEVVVVTQQDDHQNPVEPTEQTVFTKYGVTAFEVQYWTGSGWAAVPGGAVVGNDRVLRRVTFPAVTTTKIRVVINAGADNTYSRIVEVEAYSE